VGAGIDVSKRCGSDGDVNVGKKVRTCEVVEQDKNGECNRVEECLRAKLEALCVIDLRFKEFMQEWCETIQRRKFSAQLLLVPLNTAFQYLCRYFVH